MKIKKLAAVALCAAVATSVAVPMAGCIPGTSQRHSQEMLKVSLDKNGQLQWASGTEIVCDIGYETSTETAISFTEANALTPNGNSRQVLPDGNEYKQGDLKPAWAALEDQLKVKLVDKYQPLKSDASINTLIADTNDEKLKWDDNKKQWYTDGGYCLWDFDIITGSCAAIQKVQAAGKEAKFLDLSLYLDYMPNYKSFLESNPIIYLSLTSDTETGAMYYAPYFDGNDDIEKYCLMQKTWAEKLLDEEYDDEYTDTFAKQAADKQNFDGDETFTTKSEEAGDSVTIDGTKSYIEPFMGKTGSWRVDVIKRGEDSMDKTEKITVNYDKALEAAKTSGTPLYEAINDAAGKPYTGTSGNIVDLQNFAINQTHGEVSGLQLLKILQAYIDVAYRTDDGLPFYSSIEGIKRSDVFCGSTAAWDVDLLAAMSRCVVTCSSLLNESISSRQSASEVYALGGRSSYTQRISDMYALAGELYGVRGLESRYEFTYMDSDGKVHDAREDEAAWEAMDRMSDFAKEGLLYTGFTKNTDRSVYSNTAKNGQAPVYFLEHDYVQTQTLYQMKQQVGDVSTDLGIPEDYNFSPVITPVSQWQDGSKDGNGNLETKYMRFTESWRSVKNTGFCIPYQSVSGNPERLSAVLAFIDFFFSPDGQILMTYGPRSENGNVNPDGWWYAERVPDQQLLKDSRLFKSVAPQTNYLSAQYQSLSDEYFVYDGVIYKGISYSGRSIPIITTDNKNCFMNKRYGDQNPLGRYTLSYTDYARKVIGSTLPIGNKDQGFEYQCTADCGLSGANVVDAAINKAGIIKHLYQQIDNKEQNLWYVIMPTLLPLSSSASSDLAGDKQSDLAALFKNDSSVSRNAFVRVMYNGFGGSSYLNYSSKAEEADKNIAMPTSSSAVVGKMHDLGITARTGYVDDAWSRLYSFYKNMA